MLDLDTLICTLKQDVDYKTCLILGRAGGRCIGLGRDLSGRVRRRPIATLSLCGRAILLVGLVVRVRRYRCSTVGASGS